MLRNKPKVSLREITFEPMYMELDESIPWQTTVLETAAPTDLVDYKNATEWARASKFKAKLVLSKLDSGEEYLLEGTLDAKVPSTCARCGDPFKAIRDHKFRIFMRPIEKAKKRAVQEETVEDVEYREVQGHFIDLVEILSEQLVLSEPMIDCPLYSEDGKCVLCEKIPGSFKSANYEALDSKESVSVNGNSADEKTSPFAVLAEIKKGIRK